MGAAVVTIGWYCSGKWHKSQPFVQQTTITHIRVSENQKKLFLHLHFWEEYTQRYLSTYTLYEKIFDEKIPIGHFECLRKTIDITLNLRHRLCVSGVSLCFMSFLCIINFFIVFAVSKRDQVLQLLYITLHRLETSFYRGVLIICIII